MTFRGEEQHPGTSYQQPQQPRLAASAPGTGSPAFTGDFRPWAMPAWRPVMEVWMEIVMSFTGVGSLGRSIDKANRRLADIAQGFGGGGAVDEALAQLPADLRVLLEPAWPVIGGGQ